MVEPPDVVLKMGLFMLGTTVVLQILFMVAVVRGWCTTYNGETNTIGQAAGVGYGFAIALVYLLNGGAMDGLTLFMFLVYFILGTAMSEGLFHTVA